MYIVAANVICSISSWWMDRWMNKWRANPGTYSQFSLTTPGYPCSDLFRQTSVCELLGILWWAQGNWGLDCPLQYIVKLTTEDCGCLSQRTTKVKIDEHVAFGPFKTYFRCIWGQKIKLVLLTIADKSLFQKKKVYFSRCVFSARWRTSIPRYTCI